MARGAPVFLAQSRYRQRRLRDALCLTPVLGVVLFALPLLWPGAESAAAPARNSSALIYLFVVWGGLIGLVAVLGARIRPDNDSDSLSDAGESGRIESGRIESGRIESGRIESGKIESGRIESGRIESGRIESGNSDTGTSRSGTSRSGISRSGKIESGITVSGGHDPDGPDPDGPDPGWPDVAARDISKSGMAGGEA